MNLEALKKVKTANAEEHLKVVLQDVNIANNELTKILSSIANAQEILKSYNDRIEDKSKEFARISIEADEIIKRAKFSETKIIEANEDLTRKQNAFDSEKQARILTLDILDKKIKEASQYYDGAILDYEKQLESKRVEIQDLETELSFLVEDIEDGSIELKNIRNEIEEKKKEKEVLENEFNRFVANSKKEREEIQNKIKEELLIVENPRKLINQREIEVSRRERDVWILIKRFRKEFVKLHPTLDPKI